MANIIKTTLEDANDVLTYSNKASFPSSGESGKLYIAADTKYTYFWNGSSYVETRGSGYASSGHTHDDRYYTESEVDNKLSGKANSNEVVKLTGNQDIYGEKKFYHKIGNTYLTGGVLDTHPEAGGTIIGYYTNDLAYHLIRGGTCVARNVTQNSTITVPNTWFDCSPTYGGFSVTSTSDVVEIILKLPPSMSHLYWTTYGGIGFGATAWRAKNVKIETGYSATNKGTASSPDTDIVWRTTIDVTNQPYGIVSGNCSGPTAAQGGNSSNNNDWSYMRLTLTNWNNTTPRIAQIYAVNYSSWGMHNAFLSKTGGNIYGSITPALDNNYWLGSSDKKWAKIYGTEIYQNGNKVIDTSSISSQTINKSKYLISPSDVPTNANISDKENTNKAKLRVDLATSSMTTNKPVRDGFIYTNIWDINNSKNNNSQLYIPNGYHITDGRRLSVRGCKDDTWQTSWKELAYYSDIPTSLKNPKALTFGSKTYDGSSAVELTASDLGISTPEITTTTSGSGNAVTGISATGHALTITKGSTFLTSHLYRPIQVNGTQIIANNNSTALNLRAGNNISITNSSGTVTISTSNVWGTINCNNTYPTGYLISNSIAFNPDLSVIKLTNFPDGAGGTGTVYLSQPFMSTGGSNSGNLFFTAYTIAYRYRFVFQDASGNLTQLRLTAIENNFSN